MATAQLALWFPSGPAVSALTLLFRPRREGLAPHPGIAPPSRHQPTQQPEAGQDPDKEDRTASEANPPGDGVERVALVKHHDDEDRLDAVERCGGQSRVRPVTE